jgi:hypothetical protein
MMAASGPVRPSGILLGQELLDLESLAETEES